MKNDQWFSPGDKVMRVDDRTRHSYCEVKHPSGYPKYGVVYCVDRCWRGNVCNIINLVGYTEYFNSVGNQIGFQATSFRRVEEIKLCVEAAAKIPKPQTEEVETA